MEKIEPLKKFNRIHLFLILSATLVGCTKNRTPEEVVTDYTNYMSTGDCESAMELCTGEAKMVVQASIDTGCRPYETKIDSVACIIKGDTAECYCYEYRTIYGAMPFPYKLIKEEGYWKLTTTAKDSEELGE